MDKLEPIHKINIYSTKPPKDYNKIIKITCISDTHMLHRHLNSYLLEDDSDVLVHAGDFGYRSKLQIDYEDFNEWLALLPHRHKIIISGKYFTFNQFNSIQFNLFIYLFTHLLF